MKYFNNTSILIRLGGERYNLKWYKRDHVLQLTIKAATYSLPNR